MKEALLFLEFLLLYDREPLKHNGFRILRKGNKIIIFHLDFLTQVVTGLVNGDNGI